MPLILRRGIDGKEGGTSEKVGSKGKRVTSKKSPRYNLHGEAYVHGILHGEGMMAALLQKYTEAGGKISDFQDILVERYISGAGIRASFPDGFVDGMLDDAVLV